MRGEREEGKARERERDRDRETETERERERERDRQTDREKESERVRERGGRERIYSNIFLYARWQFLKNKNKKILLSTYALGSNFLSQGGRAYRFSDLRRSQST